MAELPLDSYLDTLPKSMAILEVYNNRVTRFVRKVQKSGHSVFLKAVYAKIFLSKNSGENASKFLDEKFSPESVSDQIW